MRAVVVQVLDVALGAEEVGLVVVIVDPKVRETGELFRGDELDRRLVSPSKGCVRRRVKQRG